MALVMYNGQPMSYQNDLVQKMRKLADSTVPSRIEVYDLLHEAADHITYIHNHLDYIKNEINSTIDLMDKRSK
jgi:hypothetical protein